MFVFMGHLKSDTTNGVSGGGGSNPLTPTDFFLAFSDTPSSKFQLYPTISLTLKRFLSKHIYQQINELNRTVRTLSGYKQ